MSYVFFCLRHGFKMAAVEGSFGGWIFFVVRLHMRITTQRDINRAKTGLDRNRLSITIL